MKQAPPSLTYTHTATTRLFSSLVLCYMSARSASFDFPTMPVVVFGYPADTLQPNSIIRTYLAGYTVPQ